MAFLDPVFNPLFSPLLELGPLWAILILAFAITLLITLVYKYATNQNEMKRLKSEQKEYQKRIKGLKENPQEMMKVQKEAMSKNMEYMKHSFKAMLITMLPILLIFGWMAGHLTFEPIYPNERYAITAVFADGVVGEATLVPDEGTEILSETTQQIGSGGTTWNLRSDEGTHFLTVQVGEDEQTKKVLITSKLAYESQVALYEHSDVASISIAYNKLRPLGEFSLFGWQPGWLAWYILFSVFFSIGMRKVLKVY